jgi:hypothetical protein
MRAAVGARKQSWVIAGSAERAPGALLSAPASGHPPAAAIVSKKKPKLTVLAERIAVARRIIEEQRALRDTLRSSGRPTLEAEAALRTYTSSLTHLVARARRMREEAIAKKGETKKAHAARLMTASLSHTSLSKRYRCCKSPTL